MGVMKLSACLVGSQDTALDPLEKIGCPTENSSRTDRLPETSSTYHMEACRGPPAQGETGGWSTDSTLSHSPGGGRTRLGGVGRRSRGHGSDGEASQASDDSALLAHSGENAAVRSNLAELLGRRSAVGEGQGRRHRGGDDRLQLGERSPSRSSRVEPGQVAARAHEPGRTLEASSVLICATGLAERATAARTGRWAGEEMR